MPNGLAVDQLFFQAKVVTVVTANIFDQIRLLCAAQKKAAVGQGQSLERGVELFKKLLFGVKLNVQKIGGGAQKRAFEHPRAGRKGVDQCIVDDIAARASAMRRLV